MGRVVYDFKRYHAEKKKLSKPDGIHCIICQKTFDKPDARRKYCSNQCFLKWYQSTVQDWAQVRERVLKRDRGCVQCGVKTGSFEVHHVKPISEGGMEFDITNCVTLCYTCHKEKHNITGIKKRNNHSLDEFMT